MAAGEVFNQGITTVSVGGYFTIQPASGVEVVIHNISHSTDAILEFYDGTNYITVDSHSGNGAWMGMFLHCTSSKYYRVKNSNGSIANLIACDGVRTL